MTSPNDGTIEELLSAETIGVIGCSSTPGKAAHDVPAYLQRQGYEIVPINPFADEILGTPTADSLAEVEPSIDVVCVFRPSEEVPGIVEEVLDRRDEREDVRGLWLQLGIRDDKAVERAADRGLAVVQDRCMKVEHRRLSR